jgi:hypothetical protein
VVSEIYSVELEGDSVKSGLVKADFSRRARVAAIAIAVSLLPAVAVSSANAATAAKAGTACTTAGATATVSGKTLSCVKSATTKKLTWVVAPAAAPAKTAIGSVGGANGAGGRPDFANNPAFQAFQTCLTSKGVTSFGFGRRGGLDDQNGATGTLSTARPTARPTAGANGQPFTRPTLSAADQAAVADCQKSTGFTMPAFGGRGGPDDQNGGMNTTAPGGLTLPKSTSTTKASAAPKVAPTANAAYTAAVATYIACLNTNGLTSVKTMADVKMIDPTISANATALSACASQKPTK